MSRSLFTPEAAASIPEVVSYSVAAAGVAIGGLGLKLGRQKQSAEERLKISEEKRLLDPKTGLLNYPAFQEEFEKRTANTHQRSADIGKTHGLLLGDIDDFKALNTRLTHPVTDRLALLPTAHIFKQMVRPESDVVARFGGEEFVVLLGETDSEGALKVSQKLQAAVNTIHPEANSRLGMTIAYTTFEQGTPLEELMKGLSAELTEAKMMPGKNQVVPLHAMVA